jgi:hypothetical protein
MKEDFISRESWETSSPGFLFDCANDLIFYFSLSPVWETASSEQEAGRSSNEGCRGD